MKPIEYMLFFLISILLVVWGILIILRVFRVRSRNWEIGIKGGIIKIFDKKMGPVKGDWALVLFGSTLSFLGLLFMFMMIKQIF